MYYSMLLTEMVQIFGICKRFYETYLLRFFLKKYLQERFEIEDLQTPKWLTWIFYQLRANDYSSMLTRGKFGDVPPRYIAQGKISQNLSNSSISNISGYLQ